LEKIPEFCFSPYQNEDEWRKSFWNEDDKKNSLLQTFHLYAEIQELSEDYFDSCESLT
jgi:hypothetical protein